MVQLGSLTGLAPGESVYAVRFMGERLYVVTFLQVDPLFVIDLSDAAAPTLLGQLKIPGYSDYLHPLNASHLIGVGKDAEVTGRVLGLKLALFDASDVSNPREAFTTVVGGCALPPKRTTHAPRASWMCPHSQSCGRWRPRSSACRNECEPARSPE